MICFDIQHVRYISAAKILYVGDTVCTVRVTYASYVQLVMYSTVYTVSNIDANFIYVIKR